MQTVQLLGSNKHLQQSEIHTLIMQMTEEKKTLNLLRATPIKIL